MAMTLSAGQLEAIRSIVQENFYKMARLAPTIRNESASVAPGSLSVDFPIISKATMSDKTLGVDLSDDAFTLTADRLLLNKNKAIYTTVEDRSELQSVPNLGAAIVEQFAKAWVEQLEADAYTEMSLVSTAAPDHLIPLDDGIADLITQGQILEARKLLQDQNLPASDRFLALSPKQEKAMLSIADFVRADSYGSAGGLINGEVGRLYGMAVVVSTTVPEDESLCYHRDHATWAMQQSPKFERDRDIKGLKDEYSLSMQYGVKAMRGGIYGVKFNVAGT